MGEDGRRTGPHLQEDGLDFAAVFPFFFIHHGVEDVFGGNASVGDALVVAHHPDEQVRDAVLRLGTYQNARGISAHLFPERFFFNVNPVNTRPLHLIGEEPQLLQEVLAQLQFVPDRVLLHLGAGLPRLQAHTVLQRMQHWDEF